MVSELEDLQLGGYTYDLPSPQIAQVPTADRAASRLLHLDRMSGSMAHHHFHELGKLLQAGDVLVVNNSRVFPARFRGARPSGGRVEMLLHHRFSKSVPRRRRFAEVWEVLLRPAGKIKPGEPLVFGPGLEVIPLERAREGWMVCLEADRPLDEVIQTEGEIPLPPYIERQEGQRRDPLDMERYQTVYARVTGSAAAPTAGLHFTDPLLESLQGLGVAVVAVTLHVGPGTFAPIRTDDIRQHVMHEEHYRVEPEVWRQICEAKGEGRRVIAVGTTSVRTLEAAHRVVGGFTPIQRPLEGATDLFIFPGFEFCVVDAMVTNFHLPRSSLLMLVSAFADRSLVLRAYERARDLGYRFFSYGDTMFIT